MKFNNGDLVAMKGEKSFDLGYCRVDYALVVDTLKDYIQPGTNHVQVSVGQEKKFLRPEDSLMRIAKADDMFAKDVLGRFRILVQQDVSIALAKAEWNEVRGIKQLDKYPMKEEFEDSNDLPEGFRLVTPELEMRRGRRMRGMMGQREPQGEAQFTGPGQSPYQYVKV